MLRWTRIIEDNISYLMLDQEDDNVHAAHEAGHVQRSEAGLGGGLDTGSVLQQQLHHLDPVLLARDVQRGEAGLGGGLDIGSVPQQQLHHLD